MGILHDEVCPPAPRECPASGSGWDWQAESDADGGSYVRLQLLPDRADEGYNYESFHEDLKKIYHMAGVKKEDTVFLLTDTQV